MPVADGNLRRLLDGEEIDLSTLSNAELRVLGLAVAAEHAGAKALSTQLKRDRRKAALDATGHSFSVGYEAAGATAGLILPPPFNIAVIGGAVLSGIYKLWDGRKKYAQLRGTMKAHRQAHRIVARLTVAAGEIEEEMLLRLRAGRWP